MIIIRKLLHILQKSIFYNNDYLLNHNVTAKQKTINEYYYYRYELLRKNVGLISVMEDFGRLGVFGQALEALVFTMVKMERERVAKHTKSGRVAKAAKGGYSGGRPPFGYRPVNGVLTIVPEEAEAVKKIFEMKKDGFTHK